MHPNRQNDQNIDNRQELYRDLGSSCLRMVVELCLFLTSACMFTVHILPNEYVYIYNGKVSFVLEIVFVSRRRKTKGRKGKVSVNHHQICLVIGSCLSLLPSGLGVGPSLL